jgi:putative membrane protein
MESPWTSIRGWRFSTSIRRAPPARYNNARFATPHSMQAFVWIIRLCIVLILVWFAVKNSQDVTIKGLPGQVWEAPLVFILLSVFVAGVVIGLLAWVPTVVRQRRELGRLRKSVAPTAAQLPLPPLAEPPHGI